MHILEQVFKGSNRASMLKVDVKPVLLQQIWIIENQKVVVKMNYSITKITLAHSLTQVSSMIICQTCISILVLLHKRLSLETLPNYHIWGKWIIPIARTGWAMGWIFGGTFCVISRHMGLVVIVMKTLVSLLKQQWP